MKEVEFTLSSDNKNWMDTSVISDNPKKVTVIDPRPYVAALVNILGGLQSIQDEEYPPRQLEKLAKLTFLSILTAGVYRRRAWIHGEAASIATNPIMLKKMFGSEFDPIVRDKLRYELDFDLDDLTLKSLKKMNIESMDKSKTGAIRLMHFFKEVSDLLEEHMNPNIFVVHDVTVSKDGRSFWLEEHDDWRVVQWTKEQHEQVAVANAEL